MHECHLGEEARAELLDLRLVLARHALELVGRHLGRDGLLRLDQEHRHLVKGGARATARVRTRVRARARVRARIRARARARARAREHRHLARLALDRLGARPHPHLG